jgi:hypothetical protein
MYIWKINDEILIKRRLSQYINLILWNSCWVENKGSCDKPTEQETSGWYIYIEGDEFMSNTKIESDGNPT